MATGDDIRIELRSDAKWLRSVRSLVRTYVETLGFSDEKADEVVLGVDEACTNAIRHSYRGRKTEVLVLGLRSRHNSIEIVVQDNGIPAPPRKISRKEQPPVDKETLKPGGRGMQILGNVFDEVKFRSGRKLGNCITMRLKNPKKATRKSQGQK